MEGPVADNRTSSFLPSCCCWRGGVSCGAGSVGRSAAGADPGSSPPPAVWLCAAVLRLYIYMMPFKHWPPSPCLDAARCRLCLVAGGGGWCWCWSSAHVMRCRWPGGLQSGAALIDVCLDVGPLPPRSSSPTVSGCQLGGFPAGRYWWGGESCVGCYPALIGTNV